MIKNQGANASPDEKNSSWFRSLRSRASASQRRRNNRKKQNSNQQHERSDVFHSAQEYHVDGEFQRDLGSELYQDCCGKVPELAGLAGLGVVHHFSELGNNAGDWRLTEHARHGRFLFIGQRLGGEDRTALGDALNVA